MYKIITYEFDLRKPDGSALSTKKRLYKPLQIVVTQSGQ